MVLNSEDTQAVHLKKQQFLDNELRRRGMNLDGEHQQDADLF